MYSWKFKFLVVCEGVVFWSYSLATHTSTLGNGALDGLPCCKFSDFS